MIDKGITWPSAASAGPFRPTALESPPLLVFDHGTASFIRESIQALHRTLAARDPYTGQHSVRVAEIAVGFARFLGLSPQHCRALRNAVYLHDIGKIGISDAILLKPGPLTPEERRIINTHPLIGERIVEPLNLARQEKEIILLHHERWDGNGYPRGLAGADIPFLCRLTALADVYDALVTDRPYRRLFTRSEALEEIRAHAGTQFDPCLARKFIDFISSAAAKSSL